ncbi:MAG TPA: hypothetical protein VF600_07165 [Abditibacteriaceae bacterium]|jgi:hypothetical protein
MEIANEMVSTSTHDDAEKPRPHPAASPLFWLLLIVTLGVVMPFVPVPNVAAAVSGAIVLTVVYVAAVVLFAALVTRSFPAIKERALLFALALGLWLVMQFLVQPVLVELFTALRNEGTTPTTAQNLLRFFALTVTDASLLCAAVFGGSLVAGLIREASIVGAVCALAALIDIWGVLLGGIVSQVIEKAPDIASKGMASMPTAGAATASKFIIPLPDIGAGDYLFLGLLFTALHRFSMNWGGAVKWTIPLVALALLSVVFGLPALPGLLFIGLGTAIPNWKHFQYSRDEKFALLYAGILVVVLTAGLYFGVTNLLPQR